MEKPKHGFFNPHRYALWIVGGLLVLSIGFAFSQFHHSDQLLVEKYEAKIKTLDLASILSNGELTEYAIRSSHPLFTEYCSACHGERGSGHQTAEGLFAPVLNDNDWLFEGRIETIYQVIADGLQSQMPAYRKRLSKRQIELVSKYVKALSEGHGERETAGKNLYLQAGCAACHGEDAKGDKTSGAVNLTDNIWRFEGSLAGINRTITYGVNSGEPKDRISTMPKFADNGKLTSTEIKKLAVYVYKLNGQDGRK